VEKWGNRGDGGALALGRMKGWMGYSTYLGHRHATPQPHNQAKR